MSKFLPKIYQKSIYTINYDKLIESGIRCVLFDLDNTLIPANEKNVDDNLIAFFDKLKNMGLKILIFSNSPSSRINPIKSILGVDAVSFATKPFKRNFLKVMKKYNFLPGEVALIGDQLLTDVLGGSSVGITTILIDPVSDKDGIFTLFNRMIEKHIYKKLNKEKNFEKGKYYE